MAISENSPGTSSVANSDTAELLIEVYHVASESQLADVKKADPHGSAFTWERGEDLNL